MNSKKINFRLSGIIGSAIFTSLVLIFTLPCQLSYAQVNSKPISSVSKTESINMPEKSNFKTLVINNKIYLFKYGPDYDVATAKDYEDAGSVYAYDPFTDKWETKMKMPVKKVSYSIVTVNGKIYVIGGFKAKDTPSNSVEMYDPENDSWSIKKSMPTARSRIGIAVHNNLIYTFGGWTKNSETDAVEVYDPANDNWSIKNNLPEKLMGVAVISVNNKIYYLRAVTSYWQFIYDFKEYDPIKDLWTKKALWNFEKGPDEMIAVNGRLFVARGGASDSTVHLLKEYDFISDRWIFRKNCPVQSMNTIHFSSTVNDGKIYTFGGGIWSENGWIASKYAQRYDPVTDMWEELEPLSEGKIGMSVAALGNKVFVIGGELMKSSGQSSQNEFSDKMEVYEIKDSKTHFKK